MLEKTKPEDHVQSHLHDPDTGMLHGVPAGVAQEESKGVPDSGRQANESGPIHGEK
jgi:hypothetical protein